MLTLVMGPSKSGKTSHLLQETARAVQEGRDVLLLVPEQASFTYEKRIATMFGEHFDRVTATSFSRLAQLMLRRYGGDSRAQMDETAAYFLMNLALEEVGDALTVYRRHYRTQGFIGQMLEVAGECADSGITPSDLARFSLSQPEGTLREKSYELSLILDAYDAVLHRSYQSKDDMLTMAAGRIADADEFSGAVVCVDGFSGFTAPEYRMLEALLCRASSLSVALAGDGENPPSASFAYCADTANRLMRMAARCGCECRRVVLPEPPDSIGLPKAFCRAMERDLPPEHAVPDAHIRVLSAANPAEEVQHVAAQIARLVREEGYRYRDIAVVMRDDTRYRNLLPSALRRCDIPFFYDTRARAQSGALLSGVQDAVLLACGDRAGDPIRVMKAPLLGLDPVVCAEVENYCFVWSVRAADWDRPFCNHPDGMTGSWTEESRARLSRIEECRRAVMTPIGHLRTAIMEKNGRAVAAGIYRFLEETDAARRLTEFAAPMEENERREFLQQQSLLWDHLMNTLDLFAGVGGDVMMPPARVTELLDLALSNAKVALPPRTLDEVVVGTADRMRIDRARAVFLLGAIQGEFPAYHTSGGLLTDDERRALIASGLTLLGDSDRFLDNERMIVYTAATAAEERLYVTAPRAELTGAALTPSELFERAAAFSAGWEETPFADVVTAENAVRRYAALPKDTDEAATMAALCCELGRSADAARIARAAERAPHQITDNALARRLFGDRMRLSPTRLEQYYHCPYAYFAQNGLGVRALRKAELSPSQSGILIHRVLERIVSKYGGAALKDLPEETLRAEIAAEIDAYLHEVVAESETIPKRVIAGFSRIGDELYELLRRLGEEFSRSLFEPVAFELPIREGGRVEPLHLYTADGCEVLVEGTVDRVDTAVVNGKRYVRVVDYKSGGKTFRLRDVYYGLNLQMLIYLFSIWQNGTGTLGGALPAGVLYLPALGKYQSGDRAGEDDDKLLQKQYRMNGLLLRDPAVLEAMETDGQAIFIPVKPDTEKSDALASLAQMGRLRSLVERRMTDMAEALRAGTIPALPAEIDNEPCRNCDYRGVCGFEAGDPMRELSQLPREVILGEEESDDAVCPDA